MPTPGVGRAARRTAGRCPGLLLVLLGALGCGREPDRLPVYPAGGKVVFDNKPVAGAVVILCPTDPAALRDRHPTATTGPDGTFRLSTYYARDGAPAGEYKVCVSKERTVRNKDGDPEGTGKNLLPERYATPGATSLAARVGPGDNDLGTFSLSP
ncbi:MAG: hypothetical protein C0501_12015 [Isosphaera sp.]|nr:hypothetical protein [Isosphaera sp.]